MGTTKSNASSGPAWWMQVCLEAGYPEKQLKKMDLMELYILAGKVIRHSHKPAA